MSASSARTLLDELPERGKASTAPTLEGRVPTFLLTSRASLAVHARA